MTKIRKLDSITLENRYHTNTPPASDFILEKFLHVCTRIHVRKRAVFTTKLEITKKLIRSIEWKNWNV